MTVAVKMIRLARTYSGPVPVYALRPTTMQIDDGESVAIVGPSGSGKSTLLSLLGLLDRATEGEYLLQGVETSAMTDAERSRQRAYTLGFVFQAFHLLDDRSVRENVELGLLYQGIDGRVRKRVASDAVSRVGLEHRVNASTSTLSGGERQRVAIARAIVRRPSLLLCDEPTGNLDTLNAEGIISLILDLNADGVTVVVVTHSLDVAAQFQRKLMVRDGLVTELS